MEEVQSRKVPKASNSVNGKSHLGTLKTKLISFVGSHCDIFAPTLCP